MPRPYPSEFPQRAIALVRDGRQIKQAAADIGIHEVTLHSWLRQDDIAYGRRPGNTSRERRVACCQTKDQTAETGFGHCETGAGMAG